MSTTAPRPTATSPRSFRRQTYLAALCTTALAAIGPPARSLPPLVHPARLGGWVSGRDPSTIVATTVWAAALLVAAYLTFVGALVVVALATRSMRLERIAAAVALPALRRALPSTIGAGLLVMAGPASLASASAPGGHHRVGVASAAATPTSTTSPPSPGGDRMVLLDAGGGDDDSATFALEPGTAPGTTTSMPTPGGAPTTVGRPSGGPHTALPPHGTGRRPQGGSTLPPSTRGALPAPDDRGPGPAHTTRRAHGPAASPTSRASRKSARRDAAAAEHPTARLSWTVRPGDHLWGIARQTLTDRHGHPPTDAEIEPYWQLLVSTNRAVLADPENADLIFPGQVFTLPD